MGAQQHLACGLHQEGSLWWQQSKVVAGSMEHVQLDARAGPEGPFRVVLHRTLSIAEHAVAVALMLSAM